MPHPSSLPEVLYTLRAGGSAIWMQNVGRGLALNVGIAPGFFSSSERSASLLRALVQFAHRRAGGTYSEPGSLRLRRGRYVIVHTFAEPYTVEGRMIDLLSPTLSVADDRVIPPDSNALLYDLGTPESEPHVGFVTGRMQAKAVLRTLVSFVAKGISHVDFYSAIGEDFGLIDPGAGDGGLTLRTTARMLSHLGDGTITRPRSLELRSIADRGTHWQFQGDGTPAHPTLWDRDVVAAFPFQSADRDFVVPSYVMTRNAAEDLAPEAIRLELGGLDGAHVTVSAYDPLLDTDVPVQVVRRTADAVTVQLDLTDYPRLLRLKNA